MADIYAYATKYTREILEGKANPSRNMWNRKPYRTALQKAEAEERAYMIDGYFCSPAPRSFHPQPRS